MIGSQWVDLSDIDTYHTVIENDFGVVDGRDVVLG